MTAHTPLRVRRSIYALQQDYDNGIKQPLEDLMRAWKGIKELPPEDPKSFFVLGGYHGEPFLYRDAVDKLDKNDAYQYWGGYCNHGNVLFPTWHRIYVLKVEEALQSIVPGVMLPYWDESDAHSTEHGIPDALTREKFELDGQSIDNPLRSFVLPRELNDLAPGDQQAYEKHAGYETVRYPLSGLVGTPEARAVTAAHNAEFPDYQENVALLNENVVAWLHGTGADKKGPSPTNPNPEGNGVFSMLKDCLDAPNYTVFSNTTSAGQWNLMHEGVVVPLETPHNSLHLAVGGFDIRAQSKFIRGQIAGANGDMGENNTAAMDPIFFFHHCNIDRMFWLWQKRHGKQNELTIIKGFAGTSSNDEQGPTRRFAPGAELNIDTELYPFTKADGAHYKSTDCVNIEEQLGFTYEAGSLDEQPLLRSKTYAEPPPVQKLHVSGINRAATQGSFVLRATAWLPAADGTLEAHDLGHAAVLSRYNVVKCANCMTHTDVMTHFPLSSLTGEQIAAARFKVDMLTRSGIEVLLDETPQSGLLKAAALPAAKARPQLSIKVIA
jgi:tyrosinase